MLLVGVTCFALAALADTFQVKQKNGGAIYGTDTVQKLAFHGATPVGQRTNANQAAIGSLTGYVPLASLKYIAFVGHNGAGACTATGLSVGDTVIGIVNLTTPGTATSSFEAAVTVNNQIQQSSASNLSAANLVILVGNNSTTDLTTIKTLANEERAALVEKGLIKGS